MPNLTTIRGKVIPIEFDYLDEHYAFEGRPNAVDSKFMQRVNAAMLSADAGKDSDVELFVVGFSGWNMTDGEGENEKPLPFTKENIALLPKGVVNKAYEALFKCQAGNAPKQPN